MYWYLVAALDSDTATWAAAILEDPPTNDKYQMLKNFLLSAFELAEQLLNMVHLGDRKPSGAMDELLRLNYSIQCFHGRLFFAPVRLRELRES